MNEATRLQIAAADPEVSVWLSANAGSGKTRVLTDRVARLLLAGCAPENVLCLTFTKAAAGEMQNRLFQRLGEWAMRPDDTLRDGLRTLGASVTDAGTLARARRLFARAIEAPGGLRIQTIHSFCSGLLRRFPLEAGLPPEFTEMDDATRDALVLDCLDGMAISHPEAVDAAAGLTGDLSDLARAVLSKREDFGADEDDLRRALGLARETTEAALAAEVFIPGTEALLRRLIEPLQAGKDGDRKAAALIGGLAAPFGLEDASALEGPFLFGAGAKTPFGAKIGTFPTKDARNALGGDLAPLNDLMSRVEGAREGRLALGALNDTLALYRFARPFLRLYAEAKARRGLTDFDELILRARDLLRNPDVAPWVLYRLDGTIEHLLVDEAQDTNPAQWDVIEALAAEFGSGEAAGRRTLFVVGDVKQSIYGFQGADPAGFDRMHAAFGERLGAANPLQRRELFHSFRSSRAILRVVDEVFSGPETRVAPNVKHEAFHEGFPGRVDVWPLVAPEDRPEPAPWYDPVDRTAPGDASVILAGHIAAQLRRWIYADRTPIPDANGQWRAMTEGDILILVQSRSVLFHALIAACKAQGLRVAGSDRLQLTGALAVKDIVALLSFLATPEDDLSLAAALRSPLFGWSEDDLFRLAHGRTGYLWQALRERDEAAATRRRLLGLLKDADYLRPYELIERILVRENGRALLVGRLGAEAEDAIDELCVQALDYESRDVPSLTGFLGWLERSDPVVKREAAEKGDLLRIMTVHGAKGLESPVVILPHTLRDLDDRDMFARAPGGPLFRKPPAPRRPAALRAAAQTAEEGRAAENARNHYVAMTRAESWLIVCGAARAKTPKIDWYTPVANAVDALGADALDTPAGPGRRHGFGEWATSAPLADPAPAASRDLPPWYRRTAPAAPVAAAPLRPSDLGGAKSLRGDGDGNGADGREAGTALHLLLEHLPRLPRADWARAAAKLSAADALDDAARIIEASHLADLFAPHTLAEVPIVGQARDQPVAGTIDRLIVSDGAVLAVDFKSNAVVPRAPAEVPDGILRQMGAYAEALASVYPGRSVATAILWTREGRLMRLPSDLTTAALDRAILTPAGPPHT